MMQKYIKNSVQVKSHSDSICSDQDLAWVVGVIELVSLSQLGARRKP